MKAWLYSLAPREQRRVIGGGIAVVMVLAYALIWAPFNARVSQLEQSVNEQRLLRQWMQQAAQEAQELRASALPTAPGNGGSLLAVVDQTAKQARLGNAIKRIQPEGQDTVRVTLDQVPFDDVVQWLGTLVRNFAIGIADINVDRQDAAGHANVRVTLKRTGG